MPRLLSITLVLICVQFPDLPASLLQASDLLLKEESEEAPGSRLLLWPPQAQLCLPRISPVLTTCKISLSPEKKR